MTKIFIAFAALATVSQPALAETLTRDGITYTYTVAQRGKTTIISGSETKSRQPFVLRVSGTWVSGTVAGSPVSFSTRDIASLKPTTAPAEIATR